jgi:hypothetical protein
MRASRARPTILPPTLSAWVGKSRLIATATFVLATALNSPSHGLDPVIDRFEAVPDCIFPEPRRGILSYMVTLASRIRIAAIEDTGIFFAPRITRPFYEARGSFPSSVATRISDPGAKATVVAYELVAIGEDGTETRRRLDFRYRRAAFDLLPPVLHLRDTGPAPRETRYESDANLINVESLSCSFKFDRRIEGEDGRRGSARIFEVRRGDQWVSCAILWGSDAKAGASGTVEWTARVRDRCTQGIITRSARVSAIP